MSDYSVGVGVDVESSLFSEIERNVQETENKIDNDNLIHKQKIWNAFQLSAKAIAKVYMRGSEEVNKEMSEENFRNAAHFTTALYKEGVDQCTRSEELGIVRGSNRLKCSLLNYLKRNNKRRSIRREELLAFLLHSNRSFNGQQMEEPKNFKRKFHEHENEDEDMESNLNKKIRKFAL